MISKRLLAIANQISTGGVVADIGCDHGLLGIYLLKENKASRIIASDIGEGPLSRARENAKNHGLTEFMDFRLGDGLYTLSPGEADTVVISGMGGKLITEILKKGEKLLSPGGRLILSPHRETEAVRAYLQDKFELLNEEYIFEEGHWYNILNYELTKSKRELSPAEILWGISPDENYIKFKQNQLKVILEDMASVPPGDERRGAILEKLELLEKL